MACTTGRHVEVRKCKELNAETGEVVCLNGFLQNTEIGALINLFESFGSDILAIQALGVALAQLGYLIGYGTRCGSCNVASRTLVGGGRAGCGPCAVRRQLLGGNLGNTLLGNNIAGNALNGGVNALTGRQLVVCPPNTPACNKEAACLGAFQGPVNCIGMTCPTCRSGSKKGLLGLLGLLGLIPLCCCLLLPCLLWLLCCRKKKQPAVAMYSYDTTAYVAQPVMTAAPMMTACAAPVMTAVCDEPVVTTTTHCDGGYGAPTFGVTDYATGFGGGFPVAGGFPAGGGFMP